jgi:hypothetical protein
VISTFALINLKDLKMTNQNALSPLSVGKRKRFALFALAGTAMLGFAGYGISTGLSTNASAATAPSALVPAAARASAEHPKVVELYQSQGCSSCPPANANINAIADRPDLLVLSFAVTYWDYLGWKDNFASPANTARQRDYAHSGRSDGVYTPQVVVNGSRAIVGANRGELDRLIAGSAAPVNGPTIALRGGKVQVGAAKSSDIVWLVRYDPAVRLVAIKAGENDGRKLPHRNIVRQLVRLGNTGQQAQNFNLPAASEPSLDTAVLVQDGTGGPIVAARRIG